jgi:proteasome lid subunit RPN8/RPN11
MSDVRRVFIPASIRRAIVDQAVRASPEESCGLLVGQRDRVLHAVPSPNLAASSSRYRVDDRLHLELRRLLRGLVPAVTVVGAYHSHPAGSAWPSARDVQEAFSREWLHVIVGLGGARPVARAFRIVDGQVRPVRIAWRERAAQDVAREDRRKP